MGKKEIELAYKEVFDVLNKHRDICNYDLNEIERKSECHIVGLKLKEDYRFDIDPKSIDNPNYHRFLYDNLVLMMFNEKTTYNISWEDKDRKPHNELLLCINFPTGAYIFGDDYLVSIFLYG